MSLRSFGFESLGPRTSLYVPRKSSIGELVILCTWLGAQPKHILKYTNLYQEVAPTARILLIQSNVSILTSSYKKQEKEIETAVIAVRESLSSSKEANLSPKLLLHMFSNGGTNTATQLLITLQKKSGAPIPIQSLAFDSCPANGTYWKSYNAMIFSLPKAPAFQIMGPLLIHGILVLLYMWMFLGHENPASLQRRTLLDKRVIGVAPVGSEEIFQVAGQNACYLYSKADEMCDWMDIREHADDARLAGFQVQEVVFEGSGHCSHLSKDVATYYDAVKSIWADKCGLDSLSKP